MGASYKLKTLRTSQLDTEAETQDLVGLFTTVADTQGWQSGDDLPAFTRQSIHWAVWNDGDLLGGLRLTFDGPLGFPFERVWPDHRVEARTQTADISLLCLTGDSRHYFSSFWLCCVEMIRYCNQNGIVYLYAEIPPDRLASYRRLGWNFEVTGDLRPHWGEDCYLCRMTTQSAIKGVYALSPTRRQQAVRQFERPYNI